MMTQSGKPFDPLNIMELFGVMLKAIFLDIDNPSAVTQPGSANDQIIFYLPGNTLVIYIQDDVEGKLQMMIAEAGTNEPLISINFEGSTDAVVKLYEQTKRAVVQLPSPDMFMDALNLYRTMMTAANTYIDLNEKRLMGGGP